MGTRECKTHTEYIVKVTGQGDIAEEATEEWTFVRITKLAVRKKNAYLEKDIYIYELTQWNKLHVVIENIIIAYTRKTVNIMQNVIIYLKHICEIIT